MKINIDNILTCTKKYLDIPSPTGYTHKAISEIQKQVESMGFKTFKTHKQALMIEVAGIDNSKSKVITTHIDTLSHGQVHRS